MKGSEISLVGRVKKQRVFSVFGYKGNTVIEAGLKDLMESWKGTLRS